MNPLVSIIIPTYNQAQFLDQCICSVVKQSYSNWELIIIDDCSSDNTEKIVHTYLSDRRIKYIKNQKRNGIKNLSKTYNSALKHSKGKYIAILEGDDYWPVNKLEKQLVDFIKNDCVLSFGNWIMIDANNYYLNFGIYKLKEGVITTNQLIQIITDLSFYIIPSSVIINKKYLIKIGGFQTSQYYPFVDIPTFYELALCGNFVYTKTISVFYRKHRDSTWFAYASKSPMMIKKEVYDYIQNFITKHRILNTEFEFKKITDMQNRYLKRKVLSYAKTLILHKIVFNSTEVFLIKFLKKIQDFFIKQRIKSYFKNLNNET